MHTSPSLDAEPLPARDRLAGRNARRLVTLNVGVLLTLVLHDLDHLRQASAADYDIPVRLFAGNAAVYIPTLVALVLAWRRDGRARRWTVGSATVWLLGFVVVHLVGAGSYYGLWATPYPRLGVDALSWVLYVVPVATFVVAAVLASRTARRSSGIAADADARPGR